ncbi:glycoside hydrolase, partial [Hymenopellis radicata]
QPLRAVRPTKPDSGFISDVNSTDITCSIGNADLPDARTSLYPPAIVLMRLQEPILLTVAASETVTTMWNSWPMGHYGPILNYMAKCPTDDCSVYKGDEGSPWFKIQQDTFDNETGIWPSDVLASSNYTYDVLIPKNIVAGSYILRHENLALHGAGSVGGAQFYPVCVQLNVTGGGTMEPDGLSFPGAYTSDDPGILYNVYVSDEENTLYVPPGGEVYPGLNS